MGQTLLEIKRILDKTCKGPKVGDIEGNLAAAAPTTTMLRKTMVVMVVVVAEAITKDLVQIYYLIFGCSVLNGGKMKAVCPVFKSISTSEGTQTCCST